jgi:Mrp family chromosome partitioning ATPase
MTARIHPRTKEMLKEAIREIQHSAGITRSHQSSNGHAPPSFAIGVTSPHHGEGKTTLAMALASSLAEDLSVDVMLVDADFQTHSIQQQYGLDGRGGFTDVIEGASSPEEVTHRLPLSSLRVMTAGTGRGDPARAARSEYAETFVDNMKVANRYVVFDLPATLESATAPVVAALCDGVVMVVRTGLTTTVELERSIAKLNGATVLGVVLNDWDSKIPGWVEQSLGLRA